MVENDVMGPEPLFELVLESIILGTGPTVNIDPLVVIVSVLVMEEPAGSSNVIVEPSG